MCVCVCVCVCTSEAVALDVYAGKSCKKSATNVTGDHAKIYSSRGEGGGGVYIHVLYIVINMALCSDTHVHTLSFHQYKYMYGCVSK